MQIATQLFSNKMVLPGCELWFAQAVTSRFYNRLCRKMKLLPYVAEDIGPMLV